MDNQKWVSYDAFKHIIEDVLINKSVTKLNKERHFQPIIYKWVARHIGQDVADRLEWECRGCLEKAFSTMSSYEARNRKHEEYAPVLPKVSLEVEAPIVEPEVITEDEVSIEDITEEEVSIEIIDDILNENENGTESGNIGGEKTFNKGQKGRKRK